MYFCKNALKALIINLLYQKTLFSGIAVLPPYTPYIPYNSLQVPTTPYKKQQLPTRNNKINH